MVKLLVGRISTRHATAGYHYIVFPISAEDPFDHFARLSKRLALSRQRLSLEVFQPHLVQIEAASGDFTLL